MDELQAVAVQTIRKNHLKLIVVDMPLLADRSVKRASVLALEKTVIQKRLKRSVRALRICTRDLPCRHKLPVLPSV
jgi:hypothetical protein